MIFCCVDALLQYFTGSDVFGYPYDGQILKGLFYPKQRLGIILAVFSPLYFEAVRQLSQRNRFVWLLMIPLIVVLMLTLKRSAWGHVRAGVVRLCVVVGSQTVTATAASDRVATDDIAGSDGRDDGLQSELTTSCRAQSGSVQHGFCYRRQCHILPLVVVANRPAACFGRIG